MEDTVRKWGCLGPAMPYLASTITSKDPTPSRYQTAQYPHPGHVSNTCQDSMIPHCYAEYTSFVTQGETEARQSSDSEGTAPLSLPICTMTFRSKVRRAAALGCPCLA